MSKFWGCGALVALVMLLAACGSAVSQANYDQVKNDMTVAEVEGILGKPTETKSAGGAIGEMAASGQTSVWKDGVKEIHVTFVNGKVVAKTQKNL